MEAQTDPLSCSEVVVGCRHALSCRYLSLQMRQVPRLASGMAALLHASWKGLDVLIVQQP